MEKEYLEAAQRIIRNATERAGQKYLEALNEILPKEIAPYARAEKEGYCKRKLQQLREWYNHQLPRQKPCSPHFDLYKYGAEELSRMLAAWLFDNVKAGGSLQEREIWATMQIAERESTRKYMLHLVALIDGKEPFPNTRYGRKSERLKLALTLAEEVAKEYPQAARYYSEKGIARAFFPRLEESFQHFSRKQFKAPSEAVFRTALEEKLAALEAEIAERFNQLPGEGRRDAGETEAYLGFLFYNTLLARYLEALFPGEEEPEAGGQLSLTSEMAEAVKALIEKHRHLLPQPVEGMEAQLMAKCEALARWREELKSTVSPEGIKEAVGAELAKLEEETSQQERRYLQFLPPPGKDMQPTVEIESTGQEKHGQRKVEPPNKGLFLWVKFQNAVLKDFLLWLFPEAGGLGSQPQARKEPPPKEEPTFEALFTSPAIPALVIQAMQEAEPKPLLNEEGAAILFGQATVAPVMALVDVLFARKLAKDGIPKKAAYKAICSRFGFPVSDRPDKARSEGAGIYRDYKEGFQFFFLNNRPE